MPAIKKKWIKASQDGGNTPEDDNDDNLVDEDRDHGGASDPSSTPTLKAKKRPIQSSPQNSLLRGLDGEVLLEKRKRFIPPAELKLSEWLDNNLEKRTEETLHLPHLYTYYTELCQGDGSDILDIPEFNRMVKEKFGKAFGIKETSVYKSLIKERKINQEKKRAGSGIKLKEIVHEAINHFGNPWGGVRFFALKQYIGTKYPALQIDLRPKLLKRALEMGTQYGQIDLVKGIGMAGFYKLPGGEPPPKLKPKTKKEDGNEKSDDTGDDTKTSEDAPEGKPEDTAENGEKKEESEDAKQKKKHKQKKTEKISFSKLHHGSPEKIEDILPLAITYQSAPKAASIPRIRRYIQEKYAENVPDNRWRKAVESGAEKGYWEHVSGSGITGSLHLLMDDFNPGSDQIEDQICAAIIACHEPKSASATQIKKYISQYHPEFQVEERPDKFKKALLRAVSKNMIVQLSGLGASGTFQLTSAFTPSPAVLGGGDDTSEEEEGYDSDEPVYVPRGTKSRGIPKLKTVEVSSSSKSIKNKGQKKSSSPSGKGRARKAVNSYAESSDEEPEEEVPKAKKKKSAPKGKQSQSKTSRKRSLSPLTSEEEDEEEPEYTPRKSQFAGSSSQGKTQLTHNKKKAAKPSKVKTPKTNKKVESVKDDEFSGDEEKVSKSVKKLVLFVEGSHGKGKATTPSKKVASVVEDEPTSAVKKSKKKGKSKKSIEKSTPSSVSSPSKNSSKSIKAPKGATPSKRSTFTDSDEGDVDSGAEPEYTPRKSKSRGGEVEDTAKPTKVVKSKGKASRSKK